MIPLRDDVPSRSTPIVTLMLLAVNVAAFVYQFSLGTTEAVARGAVHPTEAFVFEFGLVPCRLTGSCVVDFPPPVVTIFTSMFLHGGLFHIGGNMLYLWIFGDNVEDTLGHGRFLLFYLACGIAAALGQTLVHPDSQVPMIGASGAVSGVLGAYLLLFPYATILTLVTFGFFIKFVHIPAVIVLGLWIVIQFANGFLTLDAIASGGIAWFAHIGGFVAGLALVLVLRPRSRRRP